MTVLSRESLPAVVDRPMPLLPLDYQSPWLANVQRWGVSPVMRLLKSPLLWLAVVTAIGTALRFYKLEFPALENNETLVFWRTCGTYGEMLEPLKSDGFPPLHYSMYWLLGNWVPVGPSATHVILSLVVGVAVITLLPAILLCFRAIPTWAAWVAAYATAAVIVFLAFKFGPGIYFPEAWSPGIHLLKRTPWVIRAPVAIFGSLNIPAMYFLARQMVSKRTALVAAMLTAGSAFMCFYSRDAKMYPTLYLMVTVNVGCLLWWLRLGGSTRWLCWIASGVAMLGQHASGLMILPLSLVYLLTARKFEWRQAGLFLVGTVVIVSGLYGYMAKFNKWSEHVEEEGWNAASGIGWVDGFFNGDRTGPDHWLYATSSFLIGYEWPRDDYLSEDGYEPRAPIAPPLLDVPQKLFAVTAGILALALIPWPRRWRGVGADDPDIEPPARVFWWLGWWVVGLAYLFYCLSVPGFVSPWFWVRWAVDWLGGFGTAAVVAFVVSLVVIGLTDPARRPTAGRSVRKLLVAAALLMTLHGLYLVLHVAAANAWLGGKEWHSLWLPRYMGVIWPAVGVGAAALMMRLPGRPLRVAAVAFFLMVNLATAGFREYWFVDIPGHKDWVLTTEPPIDKLAKDAWASQLPNATVRTYDNILVGDRAVSGTNMYVNSDYKITGGRYYLKNESDDFRPISPSHFLQSLYNYDLRQNVSPSMIAADVRRDSKLKTVIVWSQLMRDSELGYDPTGRYLGTKWKLVDEQVFPVRVVWDWRERWRWVRREYEKRA